MKHPILFAGLLAGFVSFTGVAQKKEITYAQHAPLNPPHYVCYKTPGMITIDGKISPGEWDAIPWTTDFVDIEGAKRSNPYLQTKAKMAHDDNGLYMAVFMEEPHVWGNITEHDAVIYHDNDFEVFLDPSGSTHNYLEYEINALGTDWDLFLSKPYRDGPVVMNNWEFIGMKSAVYVDGTLNNPNDTDKSWSVELFIPWSSIYQVMRRDGKPAEGDQMRMNFSRVEWTTEVQDGRYVKVPIKGETKIREYNWVWAPTGIINIHLPEYWGYVQFTDKVAGTGKVEFVKSPDEDAKWILRNLYYRQNEYTRKFNQYATSVADLKPTEVCPEALVKQLTLHNTPSMYEMTLPYKGKVWHIRQDGLVWSTHK